MTETPAPRRSTRTTSARPGSATPAPSAPAPRARVARTPKPKPLPAVPTAVSHAYGARPRVSLTTQVDVSGGEGGFAAVFGARRGAALDRDVAEDEDDEESESGDDEIGDVIVVKAPTSVDLPSRQGNAAGGSRLPVKAVEEDESSDHDPHGDDYPSYEPSSIPRTVATDMTHLQSYTDMDTQFSYTGGSSARRPFSGTAIPSSGRPYSRTAIPSSGRPFSRAAVSSAGRPFSRATASLEPPPTREEIEAARPWSVAVLWETLLRWIDIPYKSFDELPFAAKTLAVMTALSLISLLALSPSKLSDFANHGLAIGGRLGNSLPSFGSFAARDANLIHRVENLEMDVRQIHKEIRSATHKLEEILPENLMVQKNAATGQWDLPANFWNGLREKLSDEGSAIAWEGFIASNKAKLDEAAQSSVETALLKQQHVINQEMFIERVQQIAGDVASQTATNLIRAIPAGDNGANLLYNLAVVNLARNTELALQTINYFSFGFGATIDPYMTSPTHEAHSVWHPKRLLQWQFSSGPRPHPPNKVLQPWVEATDCWCAAKSDTKGKAQVGILMPHPMFPTSITIEHVPARGTFDIGAAPKEFEVWVTNTESPFIPEGGRTHDLQCGDQPAKGYVCVGKGNYNIHAPNHIQNFALEAADLIGPVNKAVVKVKNNWGKDYTCIYRFRMHGERENPLEF